MSAFVVTVHALERMEERFPDLVAGASDQSIGELIHTEVGAAIEAGRCGSVLPRELSPLVAEWRPARAGCSYCWTANRDRGYVLQEEGGEVLVLTVLDRTAHDRKSSPGREEARQ